eukprot:CAMPEP_0175040262 /NCGR_PEP_ID=MMETSP0052_2-20121109/1151_1 /TAXON_ID=51329 ORGANISM="Polytomella parva, Strain SAG 63-3" /NCGR_SAMPLE_ID=MMETSP0052_2 /ASSEMBLY_ACC=CAM_ASM_000194 /LENGTH=62 /DNA_ID=CAMNT_0016302425 /DNA_START=95 /DNA_END=283 /DNA_ORIENTATION=+
MHQVHENNNDCSWNSDSLFTTKDSINSPYSAKYGNREEAAFGTFQDPPPSPIWDPFNNENDL